MKTNLESQYDGKVKNYLVQNRQMNEKSSADFIDAIYKNFNKEKGYILELGCGGGSDLLFFQQKGFCCTGVDGSAEMCESARKLSPDSRILRKDFSQTLNLGKEIYDLVFSKWAMQTAEDILPIYKNVEKVLKPNGIFAFLVVHPIRQFIEKKKLEKDYFKKEIVDSCIFNKTIVVKEPSHTLNEYFCNFFLENFDVLEIREDFEFPAAEQIGGDIYPTYLIVVAKKK
ncbi:MAG: class I SAM-dependent methyltransferase [Candidatus Pacebacteria bacterium]|nr:class I SAM-dependent methyltransferase [Candidatus Paceibacterota bacterium]